MAQWPHYAGRKHSLSLICLRVAGSAASDGNRGCAFRLDKHSRHLFAGAAFGGDGRVRHADDRVAGVGLVLRLEVEVGGLAVVLVVVIRVLHGLVVGLADEEGVQEEHEEGGAPEHAEAGRHDLHNHRDNQSTAGETKLLGT